MKKRRNFAVLLFVLALVFCAAEVFALCVAGRQGFIVHSFIAMTEVVYTFRNQ